MDKKGLGAALAVAAIVLTGFLGCAGGPSESPEVPILNATVAGTATNATTPRRSLHLLARAHHRRLEASRASPSAAPMASRWPTSTADGHLDIVSVHESDTTYDGAAEGLDPLRLREPRSRPLGAGDSGEGREAGAPRTCDSPTVDGDGDLDLAALRARPSHLLRESRPGAETATGDWPRVDSRDADRGSYIRVFCGRLRRRWPARSCRSQQGSAEPAPDTDGRNIRSRGSRSPATPWTEAAGSSTS